MATKVLQSSTLVDPSSALYIYVEGPPQPKGSYTPYRDKRTGQHRCKNTSPKVSSWQQRVAWAARAAWEWDRPLLGAVALWVTFHLPRPKNHYGTGKNIGLVKPAFRKAQPTEEKNDVDKLLRAVLDGLKGIAYRDDGQVINCCGRKQYEERPGGAQAIIRVASCHEYAW